MDHTVYNVYNDLAGELYGEGLFDPNSLVEAIGPLVDIDPNMGCSSSNGNRVEGSGQVMLNNPTEDLQVETSSPSQQENSDNHNQRPDPSLPAAAGPSISQRQFLEQPSRGSMVAPQQPENPPRNAEGHYICVSFGCSNEKTFRTRSDWQTHVNQHTRPFICSVEGCPYRSATKGVLVRHKLLKHSLGRSVSPDLLRISRTDSSRKPEGQEPIVTSDRGTPAVTDKGKGKQKRKFAEVMDGEEINDYSEQGTSSRKIQKNAMLTVRASTQREEELALENERLRTELKRTLEELSVCRAERDEEKMERKTLQGIFDRVTKQMK